jgi:alanine racemase
LATSRVEVDLSAVEHNLGVIRKVVAGGNAAAPGRPGVAVCGVLKQDAYGLGSPRLAKRLAGCGVEMLAVYTLDEARTLVEAAVPTPTLVLMPIRSLDRTDPIYRHAVSGKLHVTLHDSDQLAALSEVAGKLGATLPVHVQLDTGLTRGGALADEATRLVESIARNPRLRLGGLMTHFASPCTDAAFTREQARLFREWLERVKPMLTAAVGAAGAVTAGGGRGIWLHAANSCAVFRSAKYHGNLVRVGQSLYGFVGDDLSDKKVEEIGENGQTSAPEFAREARDLRPAVRWTSSIVHVKNIPEGSPVGYGSTWRAPRPTRIALIPVGYADGYPRALTNAGMVGLTGRHWERLGGAGSAPEGAVLSFVPVVGRVSMDQITIDVTDAPEHACRVGMEVELVGRDRRGANYLPRLAESAGTITHEILTRISPRVERIYRYPTASGMEHGAEVSVRVPSRGTGEGGSGESPAEGVAVA